MFQKIMGKIEERMYGKRMHNFNIQAIYNKNMLNDWRKKYVSQVIKKGKEKGYLGQFTLTEKGYLLKGNDKSLETKTATINLMEDSNTAGIMGLKFMEDGEKILPHIFYDNNKINNLVKTSKGVRLN